MYCCFPLDFLSFFLSFMMLYVCSVIHFILDCFIFSPEFSYFILNIVAPFTVYLRLDHLTGPMYFELVY